MTKPWEKYAEKPSQLRSEAHGPWDRYRGSSQGTDAFRRHVEKVLELEGGLADDPDDRGGLTNFGISSKANPDVDVKGLTEEKAVDLYRDRYWDALDADRLPEQVQGLAFDSAVQHGVAWTKNALAETGNSVRGLLDKRKKYYDSIVKADPSQEKFYEGWMNRLDKWRPKLPWLKYGGNEE